MVWVPGVTILLLLRAPASAARIDVTHSRKTLRLFLVRALNSTGPLCAGQQQQGWPPVLLQRVHSCPWLLIASLVHRGLGQPPPPGSSPKWVQQQRVTLA